MLWDFIRTIFNSCNLICGRDLHAMIEATPNPSPSSHSSHIFKFTDLSAPPPNNSNVSFESPSKKRKIGNSEVECSTLPLAVSFASESTHTQVHRVIKKECEELVELIVHLLILIPFLSVHSRVNTGSSQIVDHTFIIKVSEDVRIYPHSLQVWTPYSISRLVGSFSMLWAAWFLSFTESSQSWCQRYVHFHKVELQYQFDFQSFRNRCTRGLESIIYIRLWFYWFSFQTFSRNYTVLKTQLSTYETSHEMITSLVPKYALS